jgi:hypothetical protein
MLVVVVVAIKATLQAVELLVEEMEALLMLTQMLALLILVVAEAAVDIVLT